MKVVSVRFINRNTNTYSKEYFYNINEFLESYVDEYRINRKEGSKIVFNTFMIENELGYNYRNAEVIFACAPRAIQNIDENLKVITNLKLESTFVVDTKEKLYITGKKAKNHSLNVERKEESVLKKMMKNIEFGKVEEVEMSMYGPAFRSDTCTRISYDKKNKEWVDVTGLTFDISMAYKIPVAKKDIKPNDFILYQGLWVRVIEVADNIMVEKIFEQEVSFIIPVKNLFGFDFVTKLVYFDFEDMNVNEDNPFGNMLPFLMMKDSDSDMLPMLMMMQNNGGAPSMDFNNPMMMYMMMKDSDSDMLPMLMMMQNMKK